MTDDDRYAGRDRHPLPLSLSLLPPPVPRSLPEVKFTHTRGNWKIRVAVAFRRLTLDRSSLERGERETERGGSRSSLANRPLFARFSEGLEINRGLFRSETK